MKKSFVWIAAGVAGVGLAIPAFAAPSRSNGSDDHPSVPATEASVASSTPSSAVPSTPVTSVVTSSEPSTSVADTSVPTQVAVPDTSTPPNSVEDNPARLGDDDHQTTSTVEDVSGPCDEAEHVNDPRCTSAAQPVDDHSGRGRGSDDHGDNHGPGGGHGRDD